MKPPTAPSPGSECGLTLSIVLERLALVGRRSKVCHEILAGRARRAGAQLVEVADRVAPARVRITRIRWTLSRCTPSTSASKRLLLMKPHPVAKIFPASPGSTQRRAGRSASPCSHGDDPTASKPVSAALGMGAVGGQQVLVALVWSSCRNGRVRGACPRPAPQRRPPCRRTRPGRPPWRPRPREPPTGRRRGDVHRPPVLGIRPAVTSRASSRFSSASCGRLARPGYPGHVERPRLPAGRSRHGRPRPGALGGPGRATPCRCPRKQHRRGCEAVPGRVGDLPDPVRVQAAAAARAGVPPTAQHTSRRPLVLEVSPVRGGQGRQRAPCGVPVASRRRPVEVQQLLGARDGAVEQPGPSGRGGRPGPPAVIGPVRGVVRVPGRRTRAGVRRAPPPWPPAAGRGPGRGGSR